MNQVFSRFLILTFVFVLTGSILINWPAADINIANAQTVRTNSNAAPPRPPVVDGFVPEFISLENLGDVKGTRGRIFDIYEDGIYPDSDHIAKNREEWFVLTENDGVYSLKKSRASVKLSSGPGWYDDVPNVDLSFPLKGVQMFAVRDIPGLVPGSVDTLHWDDGTDENIEEIADGYRREFVLNGQRYILRTSRGLTLDGTKAAVLVLELNGRSQVIKQIYHSSQGERSIIGNLLWAGDLDGDGKLDIYFREFMEKCGTYVELHLSSRAENGDFVALAAR
jgi:hypothetical protein